MRVYNALLTILLLALSPAPNRAQSGTEHLSLCGRCASPVISSKSGIGTAAATAEGRVTREEAKDWCGNYSPGEDLGKCVQNVMAEEGKTLYRASANCTTGRITAIDGKQYALAGVWTSDVGKGRTRWRDAATGEVIGQDNASNGLAISQQWEVLCPGPLRVGAAARPAAAAGSAPAAERAAAQPPPAAVCDGTPNCTEVTPFSATITDLRASSRGRTRILTATVRFRNKLRRPILLGYVDNSGVGVDDQGNRYVAYGPEAVRGIGIIGPSNVDPKFLLQPGESSDGRLELVWNPTGREIFGLAFDVELAVREILPLPSGQVRLGQEHALSFRGLAPANRTGAPAVSSVPAVTGSPAMPSDSAAAIPASVPDACGGKPQCYSAGPFVAEVVQAVGSRVGAFDHVIRLGVRFRNVSSQPLVLAYTARSSVVSDNFGNRYHWGRAGTYDQSATGIGVSTGASADPQFVLAPGEARTATFQLVRRKPRTEVMGATFTFDLGIEELTVLGSQQVRSLRQYSLSFPNLPVSGGGGAGGVTPAAPASAAPASSQGDESLSDAAKRLRDVFKRKR